MRPAILLFTDGETEAWSWTCSRVVFIGKNTMQDFAQSSQNCNHWVLLLVRAIVLPRVIGEEPGGTNRPYWPHPVPPWTSPHPYPWPRTPFQLSLGSSVTVPVVPRECQSPAKLSGCTSCMHPLYSLSTAVPLVSSSFAPVGPPGWPLALAHHLPCWGLLVDPVISSRTYTWAQPLKNGAQSAPTKDWTKIPQKALEMPNCPLTLIQK